MLLTAQNISRTHGLQTLFTGVSLSIAEGERLGLIGPNGAGKSTLLKILAAQDTPDAGTVSAAKGLRAVYIPQHDTFPEAPETATPRDIATSAAWQDGRSGLHDRHEAEVLADVILAKIGFDDDHAQTPAHALSGGWRKRLSIARALASCRGEPDLLLLDEPTNHLDLDGIDWLENLLLRPPASSAAFASVFVTHDRVFLENVATRIVELSAAYPQGTLSVDGNYSEFLRRREEFLAGQAKQEQSLANQVRRDAAWLARGAHGRTTKQKARIQSSYARMDDLAELKDRNAAASSGGAKVDFSATGRKTRKLLRATGIAKSLGGRQLFKKIDLELGPGDCLGLLGPNGSGKTTLIRVLTGDLPADAGTLRLSDPPPRTVLFSQHRQDFPPSTLLADALCPVSNQVTFRGRPMHITAWSRRFLFRDAQLEQPVSSLSGGELARVHIARIMLEPADILILDEPTNDLDIPTLELLEESLEDFPGALVLVTHDRAMLGRLATEVLALDGRGNTRLCASLDQALAFQSTQADADKPKPPKPAPASTTTSPPTLQRKKLSYNEQREYDTIESRIHEAEAAATAAEAKLADPTVANDHAKMAAACKALEAAQATVATLYARWEELESKLTP